MNKTLPVMLLYMAISCSEQPPEQQQTLQEETLPAPYDTVAVDSFSAGAASVDVVRKIKMASRRYQDSLQEARSKLQEEELIKKMEKEKMNAAEKEHSSKNPASADNKNEKAQKSRR